MDLDRDFEEFATDAWPRLVRAARLMGASRDDAHDACQSVLVACYRRWRKVGRLADSPAAYAYRCLTNELKRHWARREIPVADVYMANGEPVTTSPMHDENSPGVMEALRCLPLPQRSVVVCTFYLDMTEAETASALGIPAGTVKSRKARALATLSTNSELTHVFGKESE